MGDGKWLEARVGIEPTYRGFADRAEESPHRSVNRSSELVLHSAAYGGVIPDPQLFLD